MMLSLLMLLFLATPSPDLPPEQQVVILTAANSAFEKALAQPDATQADGYYRQAIMAYERLLAAGVQNGKLYYNLGNAYFHRNDLGRAIAAYRQGIRLEPGNARLQANLHYIRQLRIDQFDSSARRSLSEILLFWHASLPLATQVLLAALSFVVLWGAALAQRFWRRRTLRWLIAAAALGCGLFTASALLVHWQHSTIRQGVIVAAEALWRKGNGESYALQLSEPLHPGTEFVVLEERGAWLHGQLDNGVSGWVRQEEVVLW